jgi:predicted phosphodiesterase
MLRASLRMRGAADTDQTLEMRVAILSDIHGNRHALEAVLADVDRTGVDALWCLGDLVGYGADPNACVALTRDRADVCLVGNHDLGVRGDLSLAEFSDAASVAAQWTKQRIDPDKLEFLRGLEPERLDFDVGLYHASPRDPVWEYVLSTALADLCLDAQRHRVALIGHSHVALTFCRPDGGAVRGELRQDGTEVDLAGSRWLVNPGSVGQPRDGDPRAAWLTFDTDRWSACYHRSDYDIDGAASAILEAGLPASLAERLRYGQ